MRLDEYPLDDLHQMALNEFETNDISIQTLNQIYTQVRGIYIALFEHLRKVAEREATMP